MDKNKVFVLLPDGVGLRNFAYSNFYNLGIEQGFNVVFWNNTSFKLQDLGFPEINIQNAKTHPLTDIYKNARKHIELNLNIKKTNDAIYDGYRFPFSYKNFKTSLKTVATRLVIATHNSDKGLQNIRTKIKNQERKTLFYKQSLETLKDEKPSIIFCTNQRPVVAIAPILAAQDLGIPTATFIFSWDNLPKATMVIETDYYFVWSDHMKKELLFYYPYIKEEQIFVSGTPQFENHFDPALKQSKEDFFEKYQLDSNKKYICYSGDDITTSPNDPVFLKDVAKAIRNLNSQGYNLGIVFRRCPVDFSKRFDDVLEEFNDIIVPIDPVWKKNGEEWNTILPTPEDMVLQTNTIAHTEFVINLGSSMVFDYVSYKKPCVYINYNVAETKYPFWDVEKVYKYIHFRSMPSQNSVIWLSDRSRIADKIADVLQNQDLTIEDAKKWFEIISGKEPENSSRKIWDGIGEIIKKTI